MSFEWLTGSEKSFAQGKPGLCVILVDTSGSMEDHLAGLDQALKTALATFPNARVFKFAMDVVEMTSFHNPHIRGCTNLNVALQKASNLRPSKTVVISDGVPDDANSALQTADHMAGTIDALWTTVAGRSDAREARNFMQSLARRGRGQMRQMSVDNQGGLFRAIEASVLSAPQIYSDHGIRDSLPMGHQRKVFVAGPTVNINAPQGEVRRVVRRIDVYHDTEIHNHYGETSEFHHGEPDTIDIESGQAQINFHRQEGFNVVEHQALEPPRALWKTLLLGPGRSQYRGELRDAPALPAPTEQPMQQIAYFSKSKVAR